uniref:Uncharacterized protein n=1 Tax=Micrurus lemniscatus lemniscatus TaxID=129467 RepID=A0A2D4HYA5_MICLE
MVVCDNQATCLSSYLFPRQGGAIQHPYLFPKSAHCPPLFTFYLLCAYADLEQAPAVLPPHSSLTPKAATFLVGKCWKVLALSLCPTLSIHQSLPQAPKLAQVLLPTSSSSESDGPQHTVRSYHLNRKVTSINRL